MAHDRLPAWQVPECPFLVEYAPAALDEIRLAVMEAFFAVPRGGVEIGGLLLGIWEPGRVRILDSEPLACEHAFGPSFLLSDGDRARLAESIASPRRLTVVGWYHSHNRSEISLSDRDLEIYSQHFAEPWQVALVLRPRALEPMRAAFFFREQGGHIQTSASYREFALEPLPARLAKPVVPETAHQPAEPVERAAPKPASLPVPRFLDTAPRRASRRGMLVGAVLLAVAGVSFAARDFWLPAIAAWREPFPAAVITASDKAGELHIAWELRSQRLRSARAGTLHIADGGRRMQVLLDSEQLRAGRFQYLRQSEQVDLHLDVDVPGGRTTAGATSFMGLLPRREPSPEEQKLRAERDSLLEETERMKTGLRWQQTKIRRLEREAEEMQQELMRERAQHPQETPTRD